MEVIDGDSRGNVIGFNRWSDKRPSDFSNMRGRDVLRKLIQSHPDLEAQLRQAEALLADDPACASAMHMAASTLRLGKIRVFISFRHSVETDLARAVAHAFHEMSGGRVAVTLAAEFTRDIPGRNYKKEIDRAVAQAHWFVLLLSDPRELSEWCMYETGMFRASMVSDRINRLICITPPRTARLPGPIEDFQSVEAVPDSLIEFFDGLFRKNQPIPGWSALNADAPESLMRRHADSVIAHMRGPSRPVNLNYNVELEVVRPGEMTDPEALDQCPVKMDDKTADLFGKFEHPSNWGDLIANVRRGERQDQWLTELLAVIRKACQNNKFRPISGTFELSHGGRVMRPVVESMEHEGRSERYRLHLIFVEDLCSAPVQPVGPEVLAFLTALRMHSRLRWELIERFAKVSWDQHQADACLQVFSRIEREGQSFVQWDLDALCSNYAEPIGARIREIVSRWRELRRSGVAPLIDGHGELDRALKGYDFAALPALIDECAVLVNDFLRLSYPTMENLNARV